MPPLKRQKLSEHSPDDQHGTDHDSGSEEHWSDTTGNRDSTDDIVNLKREKSHQTSKRKIRATRSSTFGAALQSLLHTDAPSTLPLSLKPSIARQRNDEKLELKARKVLQVEKKDKEDKGRVKDVIGGWGAESERTLRKVAQRGGWSSEKLFSRLMLKSTVVKLFNAIQSSQTAASISAEEAKATRGTGKPTLPAPVIDNKMKKKRDKNKNDASVVRTTEGPFFCFTIPNRNFDSMALHR
jgi:hypothetical protein